MKEEKTTYKRLKNRIHLFLALILTIHCVFYLVYWFSIGDFRETVDIYIADFVGFSLPFTIILMVLSGLIGLWSLGRFVRLRVALKKKEWHPGIVNWIYSGVLSLFLILFYVSFVIILRENPSQRGVLVHLLNISRLGGDPLIFLLASILLRRLILDLRRKMKAARSRWLYSAGIFLVLVSIVGLWLLPAVFSPNWAYRDGLPAKPALMAHRGASMLSPENTLAAIELAAEYQAFGFETDVRISRDGIPFLMHDETLARTTNVAEVFPERVDDRASNFSMDFLNQLNAGLWFIQQDPFGSIDAGLVSQSQLGINQGQKILTLSESLAAVDQDGLVILFDMRDPPPDHPYYEEFFNIVLNECRESGLDDEIWFMVGWGRLAEVREHAPQLTRVIGVQSTDLPSPQRLLEAGYEIINVDTGIFAKEIQTYREKGLGVNVYTIDQPWLFSQFWLSGVTSVTTNNVHTFSQIERPSLNIPHSRYLLYWGLFGIIVAIWLASSQPEPEPNEPNELKTPDLMDFALDTEQEPSPPAEHQKDERHLEEQEDHVQENGGSEE
ncbi:MAG: glycerophosphodiester phosphodiesterase family protein [Brevefilum sp.]